MPHTKSAKKNLKQSIRRNARNRAVKSELRTGVKKVRGATSADAGKADFVATQAKLDRAADRGIIHKNKAARVKSRLAKTLKKLAGK